MIYIVAYLKMKLSSIKMSVNRLAVKITQQDEREIELNRQFDLLNNQDENEYIRSTGEQTTCGQKLVTKVTERLTHSGCVCTRKEGIYFIQQNVNNKFRDQV